MRYFFIFGLLLLRCSTVCWAQSSTASLNPSPTVDGLIGYTNEPLVGWRDWNCPDGQEWRQSDSDKYGWCCPVGHENCFLGVECLSTSLIVEANGQRTHTCTGPTELPVCVTGTIYMQVGRPNYVLNVACWPSWSVDWSATRTTTSVAAPTTLITTTSSNGSAEPTQTTTIVEPPLPTGAGLSSAGKIGIGIGIPAFVVLCGAVFWCIRYFPHVLAAALKPPTPEAKAPDGSPSGSGLQLSTVPALTQELYAETTRPNPPRRGSRPEGQSQGGRPDTEAAVPPPINTATRPRFDQGPPTRPPEMPPQEEPERLPAALPVTNQPINIGATVSRQHPPGASRSVGELPAERAPAQVCGQSKPPDHELEGDMGTGLQPMGTRSSVAND